MVPHAGRELGGDPLELVSAAEPRRWADRFVRRSEAPLIAAYLAACPLDDIVLEVVDDPRAPVRRCMGSLSNRSDGEWRFPDWLAYVIRNYHLRLPEAFLTHLRRARFQPPGSPDEWLRVARCNSRGRLSRFERLEHFIQSTRAWTKGPGPV